MSKQIQIGELDGKFYLIGGDGYATTEKKYSTREQAEKALARERELEEEGKPSAMRWNY